MRALLFIFVTLALSSLASAQDSLLRWKFEEATSENYRLTQTADLELVLESGRTVSTKVDRAFEWQWSVSEVAEDGSAWISIDVSDVRLHVTGPSGEETVFDSKEEEEPRGYAATLAPMFRMLMKSELKAHLSPRGEIIEIEVPLEENAEIDQEQPRTVKIEIPEDLETVLNTKPVGKAVGTLGNREELLPLVHLSLPPFPQEPLQPGQRWEAEQTRDAVPFGSSIASTIYQLEAVDEESGSRIANIIPTTELSFLSADSGDPEVRIVEQNCSGEIRFNLDTGRPELSIAEERLQLETQGGLQLATGTLWHEMKIERINAEPSDEESKD